MRHTNLFVKVGRAAPRPLCTVDTKNPNHDLIIAAHRDQEFKSLMLGGVDHARVEFIEETVTIPEPKAEVETVQKARKSK